MYHQYYNKRKKDTVTLSIYSFFTTIMKQVVQLILIMLFGTDVCVQVVCVWEETGVLEGNDHLTCRRRVSNHGRSGERRVHYHCVSQIDRYC